MLLMKESPMSYIQKIKILSKTLPCHNCGKPRAEGDAFCPKCDKDHAICFECGDVVDLKKPHGGDETGYLCKDCNKAKKPGKK